MSELSFNGKFGLANSSRYSAEFQKDSCALRHWAAVTSPSPSSMAYRSVTFPSGITSTAMVTSTATGRSSESTNTECAPTHGSGSTSSSYSIISAAVAVFTPSRMSFTKRSRSGPGNINSALGKSLVSNAVLTLMQCSRSSLCSIVLCFSYSPHNSPNSMSFRR